MWQKQSYCYAEKAYSIHFMYIIIYMSALMCVYIFLHTLLWVWQSCLEKKISLESLERHCLLEIMQKDRGKHDVLTH